MILRKEHGGKTFDIELERSAGAIIMRCSGKTHTWSPHPKVGRAMEDLEKEMHDAADRFASELAGHQETSALIDELFEKGEKS